MLKTDFTLVIPTVGIPELFESLASVSNKAVQPEQVIVVIDDKGRSLSNLEGSLSELEDRIKSVLPSCEVLHNTHEEDWEMNNQTFNIGIEHTRHEYVYVTHDDVVYPDDTNYFASVGLAKAKLHNLKTDRRVVGCVFPAYHMSIKLTAPNFETAGLIQYYSPVASLLSATYWREIGKFDLQHGIWWDAQVQGELWKNNHWMYYEPLQPVLHYENRALKATSHSHSFTKAPRWGDCPAAYEMVYGKPNADWRNWYNRADQIISI